VLAVAPPEEVNVCKADSMITLFPPSLSRTTGPPLIDVSADMVTLPPASASMSNTFSAFAGSAKMVLASVSVLPAPVASRIVVPV